MNNATAPAQTTAPELVWQPLAGELRDVGHPTRAWMLTYWGERNLSARDLSAACGRPANAIAYHVRALAAAGLLDRADDRPRQGGVQHTYRLTDRGHTLAATLQALRRWTEHGHVPRPQHEAP